MRLAHHLAVASEWIRGDCVEATEFPELAQRYMVMAVPKTVVNDRVSFEGADAGGPVRRRRAAGGRRTRSTDEEVAMTWEQALAVLALAAVVVLAWRRGLG